MLPDEEGSKLLTLTRDGIDEPVEGLRRLTLEELETLHGKVCRTIPDDFEFCLYFEDGKIEVTVEFHDGMMAAAGRGFPVPRGNRFLENLKGFDWNSLRREFVSMTQSLDDEASGPVPQWFKDHLASGREKLNDGKEVRQ